MGTARPPQDDAARSRAPETARSDTEQAAPHNARHLADASHKLRQPLQILRVLHGVLAKKLRDEEFLALLAKCSETVDAMSTIVDTILGTYQLEAGDARPRRAEASTASAAISPTERDTPSARDPAAVTIFVVDDDSGVREALRQMLETAGLPVETYSNAEAFLLAYRPDRCGCLLVDAGLPGMNGFELLARLKAEGGALPAIMITGHGDIPMAVQAIKAGAADFIEKPAHPKELLASIERALILTNTPGTRSSWQAAAETRIAALTRREHQVLDLVFAGHPNKEIADRLRISQRTIESHRAAVMRKTGAKSLSALVRLILAAA